MKYELQKKVKEEVDKIVPRKRRDALYNVERSKLNATLLHEGAKKKNEE